LFSVFGVIDIVMAYYCTKFVLSSHITRPSVFTTRTEGHKRGFLDPDVTILWTCKIRVTN